jgi:hypothetical protein
MIKISDIHAGWLTLTIKDKNKTKSFQISYLTSFIDCFRDLLSIKNNDYHNALKRKYFDGEGHELYLTAIREEYGNNLCIVWEQYEDKPIIDIFHFNYDKFKNAFEKEFKRVEKQYYKEFDFDKDTIQVSFL